MTNRLAAAFGGPGWCPRSAAFKQEIGLQVMRVELPYSTMHLQGILRLVDADLAIALHQFLSHAVVEDLRARGCTVLFAPEEGDIPGSDPAVPALPE